MKVNYEGQKNKTCLETDSFLPFQIMHIFNISFKAAGNGEAMTTKSLFLETIPPLVSLETESASLAQTY